MDAQQRQRGEHVLREHETWVNAFNFSIHLSSMYRLLLKPLAAQPHVGHVVPGAVRAQVLDHSVQLQRHCVGSALPTPRSDAAT